MHDSDLTDATVGEPRRHGTTAASSRVPRMLAVTGLALVLFAGTAMGSVYSEFQHRLTSRTSDITNLLGTGRPTGSGTEKPRDPTDSWEGQALNILVLGSDARDGANAAFGKFEGMRSDTAMIVHVAADRSRVEIISIPRDLIVEVPACPLPGGGYSWAQSLGTNEFNGTRFNSAFSIGSADTDVTYGAACTILTVENMTGIYIDDWAVIDMDGFRTMVDAIGGVKMCFEDAIDDWRADLKLEAGCQTLDGQAALGVARARKGIGDGSDISRIGRQQDLMGAMVDQVLSAGTLANPARLLPFLNSAANSLTTSERLGNVNNLAGLAFSLRGIDSDAVEFITPDLGYVGNVVLQTPSMNELWERVRADIPATLPPVTEDSTGDSTNGSAGDSAQS